MSEMIERGICAACGARTSGRTEEVAAWLAAHRCPRRDEWIERLRAEKDAAVLAEREACAKVADAWDDGSVGGGRARCVANAIRARGEDCDARTA